MSRSLMVVEGLNAVTFHSLFPSGANEPQYNWEDITDNFTEAASGKTILV